MRVRPNSAQPVDVFCPCRFPTVQTPNPNRLSRRLLLPNAGPGSSSPYGTRTRRGTSRRAAAGGRPSAPAAARNRENQVACGGGGGEDEDAAEFGNDACLHSNEATDALRRLVERYIRPAASSGSSALFWCCSCEAIATSLRVQHFFFYSM
jgi:hypothetical protein